MLEVETKINGQIRHIFWNFILDYFRFKLNRIRAEKALKIPFFHVLDQQLQFSHSELMENMTLEFGMVSLYLTLPTKIPMGQSPVIQSTWNSQR